MCQFGDGRGARRVAIVQMTQRACHPGEQARYPDAARVPSGRGGVVESGAKYPVVILYEHALLGEGIAKYLRAQIGVEATVASGHDLEAVTSALSFGPAVVIFELSDVLRQVDLTTLAPQAVLIDVSTVVARGPAISPGATGLEKILEAVSVSSGIYPLPSKTCPGVPSGTYCPTGTFAAPAQ